MIEWIRQKRINHLYKKACKALAKFDNAIGKDSKNLFMKELLNRVYGKKYMNTLYGRCVTSSYEDTDSIKGNKYNIKWSNRTTNQKTPYDIIYADFNKKSEV